MPTAPQGIYINRWFTGLSTQRSPLTTPFSYVGLNMVTRHDALIDGLNVEISQNHTLQRRPAWSKYSDSIFGASEYPLNFHSFRNTDGTVYPLVDTTVNVYQFAGADHLVNTIFTKASGAGETYFQEVGNTVYMANGVDFKQSFGALGPLATNVGFNGPHLFGGATSGFDHSLSSGYTQAIGYWYAVAFGNSRTGHVSNSLFFLLFPRPAAFSGSQYYMTFSLPADPQIDSIVVYRTLDGGGTFFFMKQVSIVGLTLNYSITVVDGAADASTATGAAAGNNPGGTIIYLDTTPDDALQQQRFAPVEPDNNPPPAGVTILASHMGRLWAAVGNSVYFSGGPTTVDGNGNEAWPPANVFVFAGPVTALTTTDVGLFVWTSNTLYCVYGNNLSGFYERSIMRNFGVLSPNCLTMDGNTIYAYTSIRKMYAYPVGGRPEEIGFNVGDIFRSNFDPAHSYLTIHNTSTEALLVLSDGTQNVISYNLAYDCWNPISQPVGGIGAIKGIEVGAGNYVLVAGRATGSGNILYRDNSRYADYNANDASGFKYPAFATIGSIRLTTPGTPLYPLEAVCYERTAAGTDFNLSVLLNDIPPFTFSSNPVLGYDTTAQYFTPLTNQEIDPPELITQGTAVLAWRFYLANTPLVATVRHMQVKVTFPLEAAKNELLSLAVTPLLGG